MKENLNEWYSTLTSLQYSLCLILYVYAELHTRSLAMVVKFIKIYLLVQFSLWFLVNLCLLHVLNVDEQFLECIESLIRLLLLLIFYSFNGQYLKNTVILLVVLSVTICVALIVDRADIQVILRILSGGVGLIMGVSFFRELIMKLHVVSLKNYSLFWFNAAFFLRSGTILWIELMVIFYIPVKSVESDLGVLFSAVAVFEYLLLFIGIYKLPDRG